MATACRSASLLCVRQPGKPSLRRKLRSALAAVALVLIASPAAGLASDAGTEPGTWQRLPAAPIAPGSSAVGAWTGSRLLVFARAHPMPPWSVNVAASFSPATGTWRRLAPLHGPKGNFEGTYRAVWTGRAVLVSGPADFQAFDPATGRWRRLAAAHAGGAGGLVVWSGHELIDWGGGCCGDASSGGSAYDPATTSWRTLAASPLAPSQRPAGAWTGRELIVVVGGLDPDGRPYPARLARAAAYDPATDSWRRIAPQPADRNGATAVWDGHEMLLIGGTGAPVAGGQPGLARVGFAYDPATDRWRRLAPMAAGRRGAAMAWTGRRLLVWGGSRTVAGLPVTPSRGLAYDPQADRWSQLPGAPLLGRLDPVAVWTGRSLIVWGGERQNRPVDTGTRLFTDGAIFTPAAP
jgi:hypothetical protein